MVQDSSVCKWSFIFDDVVWMFSSFEAVARAALNAEGMTDPQDFRGVAVLEDHADGTAQHLHGVYRTAV